MARVSVEVPAELLGPVSETVLMLYEATAESLHQALRMRALDEARVHRARLEEVDELARALERGAVVSASRELLHDALYGALIDAGERLADASNRSWRGELPLERVQAAAEEVLAIDALLRTL
jgi:hypothetical protein